MSSGHKWSSAEIANLRTILSTSPSWSEGFRRAAEQFQTTETAIRRTVDRMRKHAPVDPPAPPAPEAPQPAPTISADVLGGYIARASSQATAARLRALETDLYTTRKVVEAYGELTRNPLPPIPRRELNSGLREAVSIAMLSDVHSEEIVHAHETPTGNVYNPEIADVSIARFFLGYQWLINFHRTAFRITDAGLWLGGDLMTGHIHEEMKETTATAPIETLLWLRPRVISGIDLLLSDPKLEHLHVWCSYGNHGRNTIKPYRARGAAHSYEWLLYQWLAGHYAERGEKRVRFLADPTAHQYAQVYDYKLHFHHGDETNYQGGSGGITIPLNKAVAQWDIARRCDYHHFGHWHQYIDTGRIVVNGSVIGFNAYAMAIKATPEAPQQAFYLLDSKRGKTCKSPIWVRESNDKS